MNIDNYCIMLIFLLNFCCNLFTDTRTTMGNRLYSVQAAENTTTRSFKDRYFGSGDDKQSQPDNPTQSADPLLTPQVGSSPSSVVSEGAGDGSLTQKAEDPRSICSSIPSFPGSWNELHKVKGVYCYLCEFS